MLLIYWDVNVLIVFSMYAVYTGVGLYYLYLYIYWDEINRGEKCKG